MSHHLNGLVGQAQRIVTALLLLNLSVVQSGGVLLRSRIIIQNAWQSSVSQQCFNTNLRNVADTTSASYRSGNTSGLQWLLLELESPVRLLSVTVLTNSKGQGALLDVLIGDKRPDLSMVSDCRSTIDNNDRLLEYSKCSCTRDTEYMCSSSSSSSGSIEFQCPKLTKYIFLSRLGPHPNVLEFNGLEILPDLDSATVVNCQGSSQCSAGLNQLISSYDYKLDLCLPCKADPQCSIESGVSVDVRLFNGHRHRLNFSGSFNTKTLTCSYQCPDRKIRTLSRVVGFRTKPHAFYLNLMPGAFWLAGREASVSFSSDRAFPLPMHTCLLIRTGSGGSSTLALTGEKTTSFDNGLSTLSSAFGLVVDSTMQGGSIKCSSSFLEGNTIEMTKEIPNIYTPCESRLLLLENSTNGVRFTVHTSPPGECKTAVHTCHLLHNDESIKLQAVRAEGTSSTYSLPARLDWCGPVWINCSVTQSGLFQALESFELRGLNCQKVQKLSLAYIPTILLVCSLSIILAVGTLWQKRRRQVRQSKPAYVVRRPSTIQEFSGVVPGAPGVIYEHGYEDVDNEYQKLRRIENQIVSEYDLLSPSANHASNSPDKAEDLYDLLSPSANHASNSPDKAEDLYDLLSPSANHASNSPDKAEDLYDLLSPSANHASNSPDKAEDLYDLLSPSANHASNSPDKAEDLYDLLSTSAHADGSSTAEAENAYDLLSPSANRSGNHLGDGREYFQGANILSSQTATRSLL